jgi:hypothetical protein
MILITGLLITRGAFQNIQFPQQRLPVQSN